MTFIWPWMLLTLLLLPLFVGLYFRLLERRARIAAGLGPLGILPDAQSRGPSFRRRATPILFLLALALLLFSLARPELPVRLPVVQGTVILAFDVSNSMAANDLEPTRMEAAKAAARRFVENQPDTVDIGVVAFSDGGLVVQEPTDDQPAVLATIDRLSPQGATSIGHGIFSALNSIAGEALALDVGALEDGARPVQIGSFGSAVILLLTDGENTESLDPLRIAQLAAEAGVRIYTVGIGSPEGIILEVDGFNVLTQLNEPVLEEIASLTNGAYYHAEDKAALQEIYENIDLQLTTKGEKMEITALLAGASLLFLLVGGALSLVWYGRIP